MKTTPAERERYRLEFGFPSDFASMEYRLVEDVDALASENEQLRERVARLERWAAETLVQLHTDECAWWDPDDYVPCDCGAVDRAVGDGKERA